MTGPPRRVATYRIATLAAVSSALCLSAACAKDPATPSPAGVAVAVAAHLQITSPGLANEGSNYAAKAQIVDGNAVTDCSGTAVWTSGNTQILSPAGSGGAFYSRVSGATSLTASCNSLSASKDVTIVGPARRVVINDVDSAAPSLRVGAQVQFIDGSRAGETIAAKDFSGVDLTGLTFPFTVRLTAPFYETRDVVLSAATADASSGGFLKSGPNQSFTIRMTFVGDPSTEGFTNGFSVGDPSDVTYAFTPASTGSVTLRLYWNNDDITHIERLQADLTCNGQMIYQSTIRDLGPLVDKTIFSQSVASGPCQVHVRRTESGYRLVVTYPH